jgi:proteasome accessory factor C
MSPRPLAGPRLERVLTLVPWILAHPGSTIPELAARFQVSERELERDLELLPMCGLPPYTADRLIDVWIGDDGGVTIRLAEYFERPLRLTPAEGVALVAAGRALLGVPGSDPDGPLARALAKLETAVGSRGAVSVDVGAPTFLATLRQAVDTRSQVELEYYSASRDALTDRVVDPVRIFHALGSWYLVGFCHRAGAERLFRVDRIRGVRLTGAILELPDADDGEAMEEVLVYRPAATDTRVRLRVRPEAAWIADEIPIESRRRRSDGSLEVELAIGGPAFLERLLLQLGPRAEVLDPDEAVAARRSAAVRVLARYRDPARMTPVEHPS